MHLHFDLEIPKPLSIMKINLFSFPSDCNQCFIIQEGLYFFWHYQILYHSIF